jgi:transcriptional regulator with XRE-family HTH domain
LYKQRIPETISLEGSMTEEDIRKLFSMNLKRLRSRWDLSQLALAEKADLTHNFVNDIENCKKWVSPKTMAKLSDALGIAPHELLLPDIKLKQEETERLSTYIDDFSDSLIRSVNELKAKYLKPNKRDNRE